jgi:Holliday junction resolvase
LNKKYIKGYRFEHRVKRYLERRGYKVFRLAGSKPADLIAVAGDKVYLIECRTHKKGLSKVKERMKKMSEGTMMIPLIALREGSRTLRFYNIHEDTIVKHLPYAKNIAEYLKDE